VVVAGRTGGRKRGEGGKWSGCGTAQTYWYSPGMLREGGVGGRVGGEGKVGGRGRDGSGSASRGFGAVVRYSGKIGELSFAGGAPGRVGGRDEGVGWYRPGGFRSGGGRKRG